MNNKRRLKVKAFWPILACLGIEFQTVDFYFIYLSKIYIYYMYIF